MKYVTTALLLFLNLVMLAQITLKVGDEAPRITPTEYLLNGTSKSKLKDKFLVLTLCKNWDQPCFNDLPHLDSLRTAFSNDQVVFLSLFRGNPAPARKDLEGNNFNVSLATDLYGDTQIRYGDGETGLVGWPLTLLIDDQNVVRWQGGGDDLTAEALEKFIHGQHPVIDLTNKYVPLGPDRWRYASNDRKKFNFILDLSSTKALLKSLAQHGLKAKGEAGTVEEITLERGW